MDLVLEFFDRYLLTPYVYPAWVKENDWRRQTLSIYMIVLISGIFVYFLVSGFSYYFVFDHRLMKHRLFLPNQVKLEILYSLKSLPFQVLFATPFYMLQIRNWTKLYTGIEGLKGWLALPVSVVGFLLFTDCLIYWLHRYLHHPRVYKYIHKDHHLWKVPTPFASFAFHPFDAFLQSCPYYLYTMIFPLHKGLFLLFYIFVLIWTVSIHDGDYRIPNSLEPFVNGSAHHTDHHLFYNYNYGQYFTLWDKVCSTYKTPSFNLAVEKRNDLSNQKDG